MTALFAANRKASSPDLKKVTEQLQLVHPHLEAGQPVQPDDRDETINIKKNKRRILQTYLRKGNGESTSRVR